MNIIICDDKKKEAEKLSELLNASGFDLSVKIFTHPKNAFEYICAAKNVDVCFLDIMMPLMTGVELAERLRKNGYEKEIVFLTVSNEFANESYRVRAFNYLLKPPTLESVTNIMNALVGERKNVDKNGVFIKTLESSTFVLFKNISYIEADNHTTHICLLNNSSIRASIPFGEMEEKLLGDSRFFKCHRSYIINVNEVASITAREIVMNGGITIPISRGRSQIKDKMIKQAFRDEI